MFEHLFVYGTLAPGRPNDHVLTDVPGTWQPATVTGNLIDHGWGANLGFPAIQLNTGLNRVAGHLFTSHALPQHWARLDEFEGDAYERVTALVELQDGSQVAAHLYVARIASATEAS